jgi:hypothetical protein
MQMDILCASYLAYADIGTRLGVAYLRILGERALIALKLEFAPPYLDENKQAEQNAQRTSKAFRLKPPDPTLMAFTCTGQPKKDSERNYSS